MVGNQRSRTRKRLPSLWIIKQISTIAETITSIAENALIRVAKSSRKNNERFKPCFGSHDVISHDAQHRQCRSDFSSLLRRDSHRAVVQLQLCVAVRRRRTFCSSAANTGSMAGTHRLVPCTVLCSLKSLAAQLVNRCLGTSEIAPHCVSEEETQDRRIPLLRR
jgi:hypothetical protein